MSTQKQTCAIGINANGQNAQKSTGPRTNEGKATASQNAVKHGLSAKYDCISSESQADFDLHRQRLLDELSPSGHIESMLAERVVSLSWRLERTVRIQNQVFDAKIFKADNPSPLAKLAESMIPAHLKKGQPEPSPDIKMGQIVITDFANSRVLDRLLMYERRMENSLYKTMLELQRLRLERKLDTLASMEKQTQETRQTDHQHPRAQTSDKNLQNEPNFKIGKMHLKPANTDTYKDFHPLSHQKNEPNSNPISAPRTRTRPAVMTEKTKNQPSKNSCSPSKNEFAKNRR